MDWGVGLKVERFLYVLNAGVPQCVSLNASFNWSTNTSLLCCVWLFQRSSHVINTDEDMKAHVECLICGSCWPFIMCRRPWQSFSHRQPRCSKKCSGGSLIGRKPTSTSQRSISVIRAYVLADLHRQECFSAVYNNSQPGEVLSNCIQLPGGRNCLVISDVSFYIDTMLFAVKRRSLISPSARTRSIQYTWGYFGGLLTAYQIVYAA